MQAQLNALPTLRVPNKLVNNNNKSREQENDNQTDQEKSVFKRTTALIEVCTVNQMHAVIIKAGSRY